MGVHSFRVRSGLSRIRARPWRMNQKYSRSDNPTGYILVHIVSSHL